jgi:hypothetical protein
MNKNEQVQKFRVIKSSPLLPSFLISSFLLTLASSGQVVGEDGNKLKTANLIVNLQLYFTDPIGINR